MTATLEEIRELSARSRRAEAWAAASLLATLALFPVLALIMGTRPDLMARAAWAATGFVGALFVATAFVSGQSRGAFRRILLRVKRETRRARSP